MADTARAMIAACDEPVTALTEAAHLSGDPIGIAIAYVIAGPLARPVRVPLAARVPDTAGAGESR
ncbi:hypothetical protein ACH4GK_28740 [Streptomyces rimosus]|uniref:hypothetical protein n=1 Tax=Streptomyces rimosus TaxID=1927 RepID=UPI0004CB8189|nr:hypothetical protein [Streptomyces rimosus]